MADPHRIDDLIVLGRAAPEPLSDGRETVCLGGYSPTEGWIRLYPTQPWMSELKRWNIVSVPVESDDSHDNRPESYKIAGSKEDWDNLHEKIKQVDRLEKPEQMELADNLAGDCPAKLNEEKTSLGLVEPEEILSVHLEPTDGSTVQADLLNNLRKGKNDYQKKLYVKYRCDGCVQKNPHDQSTIEWGVYRYWDKHEDYAGVIDALDILDDGTKIYLFVGNQNHQRTAYLVISILRFQKSEMIRNGFLTNNQARLVDF